MCDVGDLAWGIGFKTRSQRAEIGSQKSEVEKQGATYRQRLLTYHLGFGIFRRPNVIERQRWFLIRDLITSP